MGELWSAIGALSGVGALIVTGAAWWTQHRRTLALDREATERDARSARGRAALVIATAPWVSNTAIEVQVTNGGSSAVTDVEVIDVRRQHALPDEGWRLAPVAIPNALAACILQPRESLRAQIQLIGASGETLSQATSIGLVVVFRFRDADGRWWRREMGRPPECYEILPSA